MIAYKVFERINGRLHPSIQWVRKEFEPYDLGYIITPADGCGPFACFENEERAKEWTWEVFDEVCYRVRIKKSRHKKMWINGKTMTLFEAPKGTILADEFEILKKVK